MIFLMKFSPFISTCFLVSANSYWVWFAGLASLRCLRTLNLRRNALVAHGVPIELFENEELNTLDLSHNNLREVPEGICKAKGLLVRQVCHLH